MSLTQQCGRTPGRLIDFCVDLGAKFQVIDGRHWRTLEINVASDKHALRICREHGIPGVWINDGFGRRYVTVSELTR